MFVSLYAGVNNIVPVQDSEPKNAADQCLRFLTKCSEDKLLSTKNQSTDAYGLALNTQEYYRNLDQIRIYVLKLVIWAKEVHSVLHKTSNGRMISEWAKKAECWEQVMETSYSKPMTGIPEIK